MTKLPPAYFQCKFLTQSEREKLDRVAGVLLKEFVARRCADVKICRGRGEGDNRVIEFLASENGKPVYSLPSWDFRTCTEDELAAAMAGVLSSRR